MKSIWGISKNFIIYESHMNYDWFFINIKYKTHRELYGLLRRELMEIFDPLPNSLSKYKSP